MALPKIVNVLDFEPHAINKISSNALNYYTSGSLSEFTLNENREAFKKIYIVSRVLRDVSNITLETKILGIPVSMPIGVAPTAMQKLAHKDGEIATAKGVKAANTVMTLSTLSTTPMKKVAEVGANMFFQLYITKNRNLTRSLVEEAEALGFKALVVTVDAPVLATREPNEREIFKLTSPLKLEILESHGNETPEIREEAERSGLLKAFNTQIDSGLTWADIAWLKNITKLPIVVKGIQCGEDAILSLQAGVSAIWVSNHGGRQLDGVRSTIEILQDVVPRVKASGMEIFVDGGFRRGTDVFKALSLGATFVFLGRPVIYSLAYDGEKGVETMLSIIKRELTETMQLAGICNVGQFSKEYVDTRLRPGL